MSAPIELIIDVTNQTFNECKKLLLTKGREYQANCGKQINVFNNFERGGKNLDLNRETILAVYMAKHFDSLTTFMNDLKNKKTMEEINSKLSEPIHGRIGDAINYLLLFNGMLTINCYQSENSKLFEFACEEMIELVQSYILKIDACNNFCDDILFRMIQDDFVIILQQIKYLQNKEKYMKELNSVSNSYLKDIIKELMTLLVVLKIRVTIKETIINVG